MSCLYKAVVIDLGRIESSHPSNKNRRKHAEVYLKNKRINLVGVVDSDNETYKKFRTKLEKIY